MASNEDIQKYIQSLDASQDYDADSYVVKLENFEGPLDLLWFLIKRAKISIYEIFVSEITEQYLAAMQNIGALDLEKATDFLEIAACLVEIKSKSLLPKPTEETKDEDDPEKTLLRRLEEYRLYKEASVKMKESETTGLYFRPPDENAVKPRLVLNDMTMDGLMDALKKMFLKLDKRAEMNRERKITLDRFTVAEKIEEIKDRFDNSDFLSFYDLFDSDYNKSEIITTFQAMLELLKNQFLTAEQQQVFGDIKLHRIQSNND